MAGKGHVIMRRWAIKRLPDWQRNWVGGEFLDRLASVHISIQDTYAGGQSPELDVYCVPPSGKVSLHDVNSADKTVPAMKWYFDQVKQRMVAGKTDEAMKFLGVLCHWNEDTGWPCMHSSPIGESVLKQLVPPPREQENRNYLYGYGGISDTGTYELPEEDYSPKLLGTTSAEAAGRLRHHQRVLSHRASSFIIPLVQDEIYGDGSKAETVRAQAALHDARNTADIIYTALCLAGSRFSPKEADSLKTQELTDWRPESPGARIGHPYYVTPFLVNQGMDAERNLHSLRFPGEDSEVPFGFGMGTPFCLNFLIAPTGVFDRFRTRAGLHPCAGLEGRVVFSILFDDEEQYRSEAIAAGQGPVTIELSLPEEGSFQLGLRTEPVDDSPSLQNLAVWGEPTLHKKEELV